MIQNFCPHCMRPAAGGWCPNCGGDTSWRGQEGIDLPVGTVLNSGNGLRTYQIGAARGKGGFGITYIALEINSGRRVAVKEYFPTRCAFRAGNEVSVQTMSGQEDVFRAGMDSFLEEGRMLLSQDDLTCVVHVIDYFQANGTAYLVMEYLDGVALHTQMVRMGGRIPVNELMPRLAPLMRDIGQLHRRGVIHRDISPDNIMWMPDGTLKLLDFGSARSMENGRSMTVLMKHGFSPIEQYRSTGQGAYTDIYALAATIYYCVTGVVPQAAVERIDEDRLQTPTALGAALTVNQETALLWALSVQPNARPQSMEEFAALLYSEGDPVQPGGISQTDGRYYIQTDSQNRGKNKMPILIGGVAAAVVLLLIVVIIAWNRAGGTVDDISSAPVTDPSETPGSRTGVTDDGYLYEIKNRNNAVLTGYEGNSGIGSMPDYVDNVPVTEIADNAFAGVPSDKYVYLPMELKSIGAGAFRGCDNLQYVVAYSDVTTETTSFIGCEELWFVFSFAGNVSHWNLPSSVSLFYAGMETGAGPLANILVPDGKLLGGKTEDGKVVLLDAQSGLTSIDLEGVDWICPGALDDLSYGTRIDLGDNTLYSYETYNSNAIVWYADDGTLSDMWLISCAAAQEINAARPSGAARIEPDINLVRAAMVRVEEFAVDLDYNNRPDGSSWVTALNDQGYNTGYASRAASYDHDDYQQMRDYAVDYLANSYTSAIDQGDYAGQYYSRVGAATARRSDGRYVWYGFVMIP